MRSSAGDVQLLPCLGGYWLYYTCLSLGNTRLLQQGSRLRYTIDRHTNSYILTIGAPPPDRDRCPAGLPIGNLACKSEAD